MRIRFHVGRTSAIVIAALAAFNTAGTLEAQADFASAVTATKPIAYYRLSATSGKSETGISNYKSQGGASVGSGSVPSGLENYAKFDGQNGWILTTQKGEVSTAASIMAWVNLADLPSKTGHFFYVAGESENGNDLDLQFETDDKLRFFTASGGSVQFAPPVASLVNQWHMIVATLETTSHSRTIYWDGKQVAKDNGGGRAGKTAAFSIGASTVFGGRWFKGGIADVALWNRALKASEVTAIYTASGSTGAGSAASGGAATSTGPFATTAKVEADDTTGPMRFKREEEIAFMFMSTIEVIERDCQLSAQKACNLDQLLTGSVVVQGRHLQHLKFDPNKTDPNYTYTLAAGGMAWEAHANPKKPGLKGFCFMSRGVGATVTTYNATGKAGWVDTEIMSRGVSGDSFGTQ